MNEEAKLHLALMQTNNIMSLVKGNQYESFLNNKLIGVQVELNRQLSLLTNSKHYSKVEE
jgi:hypothetical protein